MIDETTRPSLAAVTLRKEAIASGLTDRDIARLLRDGDWHRIRHGAYCPGSLWRSLDPGGRHMMLARAEAGVRQHQGVLRRDDVVVLRDVLVTSAPSSEEVRGRLRVHGEAPVHRAHRGRPPSRGATVGAE